MNNKITNLSRNPQLPVAIPKCTKFLLLYIIIPFFMVGSEMRSHNGFGIFFKLGLSAGLVLLIISCLSFGIKAISGKPDFKKELLTGGICGIPLMLLFTTICMLFTKDNLSLLNPGSLCARALFQALSCCTCLCYSILFNNHLKHPVPMMR